MIYRCNYLSFGADKSEACFRSVLQDQISAGYVLIAELGNWYVFLKSDIGESDSLCSKSNIR
jgi:hypothetical protein